MLTNNEQLGSKNLQRSLTSLLQSRLGCPVSADSLEFSNSSSSGPWPWTNLSEETRQGVTASNNTVPRVSGTHKPSTMLRWVHLIVVVHHCQEQQYCRYSRVTGDSIAGCLGSSLGTGWGVCISGWSKTTTPLCGKWGTWGGLGHLIKMFPVRLPLEVF